MRSPHVKNNIYHAVVKVTGQSIRFVLLHELRLYFNVRLFKMFFNNLFCKEREEKKNI